MKIILCALLITTCIFSCVGCSSEAITDTSGNKVDISIDYTKPSTPPEIAAANVVGKSGENVVVPFYVTADCRIAATDINIEYDPSGLEFVSASTGSAYSDGILTNADAQGGKVAIALITLEPPKEGGEMFTVTFKVTGQSGKEYSVSPTVVTCCESDIVTQITPKTTSGKVTVQ